MKNTLSDNGEVARGVCKIEEGYTHITDVAETSNMIKTVDCRWSIQGRIVLFNAIIFK